jgi:CxxC-x17-CxxC domain-containing protein
MEFVDRILTCNDCGGAFIFTAGEQLFFNDKQFKNDPKRCKPCKSKRAASKPTATGERVTVLLRTETRTECSACGIETTVPFKPTQGRPVLCRQCFQMRQTTPVTVSEDEKAAEQLDSATAKLMAGSSNGEHGIVGVELTSHVPHA